MAPSRSKSSFPKSREEVLNIIRLIANDRIKSGKPEDALFYAKKLYDLTFEQCAELDFQLLIHCLYVNKQYEVLISFIEQRPEFKTKPKYVIYLAKSLVNCKKYERALLALRDFEVPPQTKPSEWQFDPNNLCSDQERAEIFILYGKIKAAETERETAIQCFREALKIDKWSAEAFVALAEQEKHPVPNTREYSLRNIEPVDCPSTCNQVIQELFQNILGCNDPLSCPSEAEFDFVVGKLFDMSRTEITWSARNIVNYGEHTKAVGAFDKLFDQTVSRLLVVATEAFECINFDACLSACKEIRRRDPLNRRCIILLTACLSCISDNDRIDLFSLANELSIAIPDTALAWYVSAVYEYCIAKDHDKSQAFARKFFTKATDAEYRFSEAWIGLGHALARDNEHDQAIEMYYKAAKFDQWDYRPIYFIGVEYSDGGHYQLADKFLNEAVALCTKQNSLHLAHRVLNEYGCLKFRASQYDEALFIFEKALEMTRKASRELLDKSCAVTKMAQRQFRSYFHVLHVNTAHTCAQLGRHIECLEHLVQALQVVPHDVDVLLAIAMECVEFGLCRLAFDFAHDAGSIDPEVTNTAHFVHLQKLMYLSEEMDAKSLRPATVSDELSCQQMQGKPPTVFFDAMKLVEVPLKVPKTEYRAKWLCNEDENDDDVASVLMTVSDVGYGYSRAVSDIEDIDIEHDGSTD